jgi:hypothetical protein
MYSRMASYVLDVTGLLGGCSLSRASSSPVGGTVQQICGVARMLSWLYCDNLLAHKCELEMPDMNFFKS